MLRLDQIAAIFTVVGGTLALLQLTAILLRLQRRPRLNIRLGTAHLGTKAGREVLVLPLITTNSGSLSARNILWNYDLPSGLTIVSPDAEHHEHAQRITIARALEHLHPQVEAHHEIVVEHPPDFGDFAVRYRIHLEDSRPISGSMLIKMGEVATPAATRAPTPDKGEREPPRVQ